MKAMVFPVVMYGCEIWTGYERKLSTEELMLLNCGVGEVLESSSRSQGISLKGRAVSADDDVESDS